MTTLERAIETYGKDMQLNVAVEELSELIKEICKYKRGADNRKAIIEEMADCYIMLDQLQTIFNIHEEEICDKMEEKVDRLEKRLDGNDINVPTTSEDKGELNTAHWEEENRRAKSSKFICSACGRLTHYIQPTRVRNWEKRCLYKYCPNCGAKMDGERNKNEI